MTSFLIYAIPWQQYNALAYSRHLHLVRMLYMYCDSYDVSILETFRFCLSATLKHSLVFKRLSFDDVDDVGVHKIRNQKTDFLVGLSAL